MEKEKDLSEWLMRTGIDGDYDFEDPEEDRPVREEPEEINTVNIANRNNVVFQPMVAEEVNRAMNNGSNEYLAHYNPENRTWEQRTLGDPNPFVRIPQENEENQEEPNINHEIGEVDGFRYLCHRIKNFIIEKRFNMYRIRQMLDTIQHDNLLTSYEIAQTPETRGIRIMLNKHDLRYSFEIPYIRLERNYYEDHYDDTDVPF